ncbi:MAG TPA: hypothetical protein DD490_30175, partial [Acidobacteria bacterium]|nr:hypothetical protein [Acidobacteriota bacterium]
FLVGGATVTATKTASGTFVVGGTVTYTIVLTNSGTSAAPDNAGDEFTDTLPAGLTLTGASATSGTASTAGNTATWNGSIPASGSVTLTITATVNAGTEGTTLNNQGTVSFDSDLNGSNESTAVTDDPGVTGTGNPTPITITGLPVQEIPTVSEIGLLALGLGLLLAAWTILRRRSARV